MDDLSLENLTLSVNITKEHPLPQLCASFLNSQISQKKKKPPTTMDVSAFG